MHAGTFNLYESRKSAPSDKSGALPGTEGLPEEACLKEKDYIADVLAGALNMRGGSGAYTSRLMFRKRLFRESDEAVTEPQFVKLSYVQAQHDYLTRDFPVSKDDASQICALQILADAGQGLAKNEEALQACIDKCGTAPMHARACVYQPEQLRPSACPRMCTST
jgi:hypothetical protein